MFIYFPIDKITLSALSTLRNYSGHCSYGYWEVSFTETADFCKRSKKALQLELSAVLEVTLL